MKLSKQLILGLAYMMAMLKIMTAAYANEGDGPEPAHATGNGAPQFNIAVELKKPIAGVDFPTDSPPPENMVVLEVEHRHRILVRNAAAQLVRARAGHEFPTDSPPPTWVRFYKVLAFDHYHRYVLRLALNPETNQIQLTTSQGIEVNVQKVISIEKVQSEHGFDTYVMLIADGSSITL